MAWVFQGNPEKFDIDDYLSRYPELVYWRTPRYSTEIAVGDRAFIWRSGKDAGAVAIGTVVEAPTPASAVKYPEALGADLWRAEKPDPKEPKTGIRLDEVRLTTAESMVPRTLVKSNSSLSGTTLIRMPNGTVFPLSEIENVELERLWGGINSSGTTNFFTATEGEMRLWAHYKRERSNKLKEKKLEAFRSENGMLACELCSVTESSRYPTSMGKRIFDVHHRKPLSTAMTPRRTTLTDLAVLCASCHRAVHADVEVERNYESLRKHFTS